MIFKEEAHVDVPVGVNSYAILYDDPLKGSGQAQRVTFIETEVLTLI